MRENNIKNNQGVTLLELIVAVSLFTVSILLATQIFRMVIDGQRDAIAAQNMQESMRYTFERISKEIRMAQKDIDNACIGLPNKIYEVSSSGSGSNDILTFLNYHGQCIEYSLSDGRLYMTREPGVSEISLPITVGKVNINNLRFEVMGSDLETDQLLVIVKINAEVKAKEQFRHKIKIQTSISSRYYE